MKKFLAVLVVVALVGGCATSWFCSNRDTIQTYIDEAQVTVATLTAQYGANIPANIQAIIFAAQIVIDKGQEVLAAIPCPSDADVQSVQDTAIVANKASIKAGMGMMIKAPKK